MPTLAHLVAEAVAVGATAAALSTGLVSLDRAGDAVRHLAPVVAFLATILVVSDVCARAGLVAAAGRLLRPGADRGHAPAGCSPPRSSSSLP